MITSAKLLFFRELSSPQTENLPIFNVLKGILRFQRGENKERDPAPTSSVSVLRRAKRQADYLRAGLLPFEKYRAVAIY